ncbi:MAG: nuclear transport factor 2 family protein [Gemmataceae bacterium]|nr:nuclear transport factor 2 family protein [Gemmataceae bacterium]
MALHLAACGLALLPALLPPLHPTPNAKDAVQKVLDDQVVAWNRRDLEGFMAGYWKSPELSFYSGGTKTAGWQATLDRYKKKYQGEGKEMGKLAFKEIAIDMIGADRALVRGRWHLTLTKDSIGGLFTLVMKKMPEGWRIIHDHTSN